jgi:hypothetical protein
MIVLLEYSRKLSAAAHVAAGICILLWGGGGRNCTFNSCLRYVRYTRHGRRTSISDLQRVAEWALFVYLVNTDIVPEKVSDLALFTDMAQMRFPQVKNV